MGLLVFLLASLQGFLFAQEDGIYYKYPFKQFCEVKADGYKEVLTLLYRNIKYPPIARENELHGLVEVIVFYDLKSGFKLFVDGEFQVLVGEVKEKAEKVFSDMEPKGLEKFVTQFDVLFELEHLGFSNPEEVDDSTIYVKSIKPIIRHSKSH